MPSFSFIIPVKPGGEVAALPALGKLDSQYPFEVLIAEGCVPSRQRNAAVYESKGDLIYFLDDDSQVSSECLAMCAAVMENPAVAVAGGPSLTPATDSRLQRLFGTALASLFGAGTVCNRYRSIGKIRETTDKELILCNLVIRKEVFVSLGGFDERLYPNEENELLDRALASGLKLVHIPNMAVKRSQRKTIGLFARQMFSYGKGRARQTLISGVISPVSFAPLFFVLYLALLLFIKPDLIVLVPLIVYLSLDMMFSLTAVFMSGTPLNIFLLLLFPLIHVANGCGLLWGLLCGTGDVVQNPSVDITVKRIKTFEQVL